MSKRILIADDSGFLAKKMKEFFETKLNYEVLAIAKDGNEAVAAYKEHEPDLVTMDLTMPNKDGKTAIVEILEEFPDAKILVVSAVKGNTMLECMKIGAKGFVEKPLKFSEEVFVADFIESIEEALEG